MPACRRPDVFNGEQRVPRRASPSLEEVSIPAPGAQLWSYKDPLWQRMDLNGFEVAARDGSAGRVGEDGGEYFVLHTGPWVFRRMAVIPAGLVEHVDADQSMVYVRVSRDEIRSAPEPEAVVDDAGLKRLLSDHYRNAIPAG